MTEPGRRAFPATACAPPRPRAVPATSARAWPACSPEELAAWFTAHGQPAYRARQVRDAAWRGRQASFDEILTLPAALRPDLDAAFRFDTMTETEVRVTDGGLTEKALHRLSDGLLVESVLMHYPARAEQPRAPHAVHLVAGRAAPWAARSAPRASWAWSGTSRRRRSWTRSATPPAGCAADGGPPHQRRVHGHGRAAAQPRPRPRVDRRAQRPDGASASAPATSPCPRPASCPGSGA